MFYSTQILSRKGPLATIWIASHLEKRLKKSQIFETSIAQSVELVLNPEAPLALRLSGQLLLGIVRVYIRKLQLLEIDAQDAIAGLQQLGSQPAGADVRDGKAAEAAITLPLADPMDLFDPETGLFGAALLPLPTQSGSSRRSAASGSVSLTLADNLSSQGWGSGSQDGGGWYDSDAVFEGAAPGEEIDRRFSIELEMLRSQAAENPRAAAAAAAQGALVFDPAGTMHGVGDDAFLHGGADDALAGLTPVKTPVSPGGIALPGSVPSLPLASAVSLPPLPGSGVGTPLPGLVAGTPTGAALSAGLPGSSSAVEPDRTRTPPGSRDRPAVRSNGAARLRRKRAQVDVGEDGNLETELSGAEMRALLQDRSCLVRRRGVTNFGAVGGGAAGSRGSQQRHLAHGSAAHGSSGPLSAVWPSTSTPAVGNAAAGAFESLFARALSIQAPRHDLGGADLGLVVEDGGGVAVRRGDNARDMAGDDGGVTMGPSRMDRGAAEAGAAAARPAGILSNDTWASQPAAALPAATPDVGGYDDWGTTFDDPMFAAPATAGGTSSHPTPADWPGCSNTENDNGGLPPSETRRLSLTSERTGNNSGPSATGTGRATLVLEAVRARFATPDVGSKRRRGGADRAAAVSTAALLAGRSRREAAAWFYELLVLQNRGQLALNQVEPYADISILQPEVAMLMRD